MVRPGNTFQSFMRASIEKGLFPTAEKDPDGFMAALMARRRNPSGPREQYLSSGIWLQVSDYRMKDGSQAWGSTQTSRSKSSGRPSSRMPRQRQNPRFNNLRRLNSS